VAQLLLQQAVFVIGRQLPFRSRLQGSSFFSEWLAWRFVVAAPNLRLEQKKKPSSTEDGFFFAL
jgi:hypothetical protein